jgi:hypothetical protein
VGAGRALVDIHACAAVVLETGRTVARIAARGVLTRTAVAAAVTVERALVDVGADLPVTVPPWRTAADVAAILTVAGSVGITTTRVHAAAAGGVASAVAGIATVTRVATVGSAAATAGIATTSGLTAASDGAARCAAVDAAGSTARRTPGAFVIPTADDRHNDRNKPSSSHEGLLGSKSIPRIATGLLRVTDAA